VGGKKIHNPIQTGEGDAEEKKKAQLWVGGGHAGFQIKFGRNNLVKGGGGQEGTAENVGNSGVTGECVGRENKKSVSVRGSQTAIKMRSTKGAGRKPPNKKDIGKLCKKRPLFCIERQSYARAKKTF